MAQTPHYTKKSGSNYRMFSDGTELEQQHRDFHIATETATRELLLKPGALVQARHEELYEFTLSGKPDCPEEPGTIPEPEPIVDPQLKGVLVANAVVGNPAIITLDLDHGNRTGAFHIRAMYGTRTFAEAWSSVHMQTETLTDAETLELRLHVDYQDGSFDLGPYELEVSLP